MSHFQYILYSKSIDKYYIGISSNPQKRVEFHNLGKGGGNAYTKSADDWILVYTKEYPTKQEAMMEERRIKRKKSRKYIEELISKE